MASRRELKEQRRREREEAERRAELARMRQRRIRALGALAAVVAVVGVGAALSLLGGSGSDPADAFEAKPEGIADRAAEADIASGPDHFHPTVRVVVNGEPVPVPPDAFKDDSGASVVPLEYHEGDEKIHAEGAQRGKLTLGQVMTVWGVPLSPTRLGDYRADGRRKVSVFVKRKGQDRFVETREFDRLQLDEGVEVYLVYGTPQQSPIVQ